MDGPPAGASGHGLVEAVGDLRPANFKDLRIGDIDGQIVLLPDDRPGKVNIGAVENAGVTLARLSW